MPMKTLKNCTAVSKGKCGCKEGAYKTPGEGRCIPHVCSAGYMVSIESLTLTCRPCPQGSYSSTRNNKTRCTDHTDCERLGKVVVRKGNATHNVVCDKKKIEIFPTAEGEPNSQDLDLTDRTALPKTVTSSTTSEVRKEVGSNTGKEQEIAYENNTPHTAGSVFLSKLRTSENATTSSSQTTLGETSDDFSNHSSAQVQPNMNNTVNEELLTSSTTPTSSTTSLPQATVDVAQADAEQDKMHNSSATSMSQASSPDTIEKSTSEIAVNPDPVDCNTTADPHLLPFVPEASSDTTTSSVVKDPTEVSVSKITDESKQLLPVNVQTPEGRTDPGIAINANIDRDTSTDLADTQATQEGAGQTIPSSEKVENKDENYSTAITVIAVIVAISLLLTILKIIHGCYKKWHRSRKKSLDDRVRMTNHEGEGERLIFCGFEEQLFLENFVLRPDISVEDLLTEIAQNIDRDKWQQFMRHKPCPGVTETKIQDEIHQNPRNVMECIYQCLLDWKRRNVVLDNDSMKDLVAALSKFDKKLALDIKRNYCE